MKWSWLRFRFVILFNLSDFPIGERIILGIDGQVDDWKSFLNLFFKSSISTG